MLKVLALIMLLVQAQTPPKTTLDGVFSEEQALRGKNLYGEHCAFCHGAALEGVHAPRLVGDRFIDQRREAMLDGTYNFIRRSMPPPEAPRTKVITETDYLDIVTYILKANQYPSGPNDLKVEDVASIMVVGKNGPQPVPSGALVISIGCLQQGPQPDQWLLTSATEPARTPISSSSAVELKASAGKPLGTLTFRIVDREALPRFSPTAHVGHKMQVKGTIFRTANADRISVTSVEMLDAACKP
jgi:S-disulfanyl-L-cysteine oxidoreductase SoxD